MSNPFTRWMQRLRGASAATGERHEKPNVFVKELSPRSRRHLLRHFLALEEKDRD